MRLRRAWRSLRHVQAVASDQTIVVLRDEFGTLYDVVGTRYVRRGISTIDIRRLVDETATA